jgi:hypothetical protein
LGVARISGMVSDADWDAQTVAPLGIGTCMNDMPNVSGVSYVCDVTSSTTKLTLVSGDKEYNFSAPVEVEVRKGCTYY